MAPPKTMVTLCQHNHSSLSQKELVESQQQTAKPRKRNKSKQQQQANSTQPNHPLQQNQQVSDIRTQSKQRKTDTDNSEISQVVPSERITIKKLQKSQINAPMSTKPVETLAESNKKSVSNDKSLILAKQISNDETDEIDAGIELDGSSYSGSSVKDISEDQLKSASVSPVMAQTNLVNETSTKLAADITSIEQVTGSLCSAPSRKTSASKQELAAIQQVIEADEQLLQQKLREKQLRKSNSQSQDGSETQTSSSGKDSARTTGSIEKPSASGSASNLTTLNMSKSDRKSASESTAKPRRRFSAQSSLDNQENSLCKVCEQHVYQMERMMAEKSLYHKRCFRCYQCKIQLRVDNYSSHEGQVYCKAHHRQIFQPQVKLDNDEDVDIVAKSNAHLNDDYLLHRGRLSELSFSFLQQDSEEIRQRQMIICENEPAELPKDVVRSETKVDDGFQQLNLNLNNILEKFERGTASGEESQPSSASNMIDKPSFNIKKTLMAFESKLGSESEPIPERKSATERPVVRKLANLETFFKNSRDEDDEESKSAPVKPLVVRRSESLMNRLKKYESRIAGEPVDDDDVESDTNDNLVSANLEEKQTPRDTESKRVIFPKRLNLSSLKNQWENGDISSTRDDNSDDDLENKTSRGEDGSGDTSYNGRSPLIEKHEELNRIRQQLARRKSGGNSSIRNIYEDAIKEAQQQQLASKRNSGDLSALNGFSTSSIQKQLLQNESAKLDTRSLTKEQFQLNMSKKANKLKEKFELGLINNCSHDDSENSDGEQSSTMSKMDQLRQEKLEDLSIFTEGEIKAREARSMFQQIDRSLSSSLIKPTNTSRTSLPTRVKLSLDNQREGNANPPSITNSQNSPQPIRLTNNVST